MKFYGLDVPEGVKFITVLVSCGHIEVRGHETVESRDLFQEALTLGGADKIPVKPRTESSNTQQEKQDK